MSTDNSTFNQVAKHFDGILSTYAIPLEHHQSFLQLVIDNELDHESHFAAELDSNAEYQKAIEDALAIKYTTLRELFDELSP